MVNLEVIGARAAWSRGYTGKDSVIAIPDTGIDMDPRLSLKVKLKMQNVLQVLVKLVMKQYKTKIDIYTEHTLQVLGQVN